MCFTERNLCLKSKFKNSFYDVNNTFINNLSHNLEQYTICSSYTMITENEQYWTHLISNIDKKL